MPLQFGPQGPPFRISLQPRRLALQQLQGVRLALAHRLLADPQIGRNGGLGLAVPKQLSDQPAIALAELAQEPTDLIRVVGGGGGIVRGRTIVDQGEEINRAAVASDPVDVILR